MPKHMFYFDNYVVASASHEPLEGSGAAGRAASLADAYALGRIRLEAYAHKVDELRRNGSQAERRAAREIWTGNKIKYLEDAGKGMRPLRAMLGVVSAGFFAMDVEANMVEQGNSLKDAIARNVIEYIGTGLGATGGAALASFLTLETGGATAPAITAFALGGAVGGGWAADWFTDLYYGAD